MVFKCCRSRFCTELVASLQSWLDLFVCRSVRARDVGCSENAYNKSLLYSGQKYYRNLKLAGQGNLQDQVTNSFEVPLSLGLSKAFIEEKRKIKKKHQFSCQVIVITDIQIKCE